jgi:chemotaxis signal transduction protein
MMNSNQRLLDLNNALATLRGSFDQAFAEPMDTAAPVLTDMLLIRLGGQLHALRLNDAMHLHPLTSVTSVRGPLPELLGVEGFRGDVLPVYDLRLIMGTPASTPAQWCVVARHLPVALAFDGCERHLRCPADTLAVNADNSAAIQRHLDGWLRTPHGTWPIVDVAAVLRWIQGATRTGSARLEG